MDTESFAQSADYAIYLALNIGVFVSAVLVLLMQPGFMLFEAGSVSRKNAINNIFKNLADLAFGGLVFWFVGFAIFNGDAWAVAIFETVGLAQPAGAPSENIPIAASIFFLFQLGFASAAVTVSSGAVTARISPYAYLVFVMIFTGLIYPTIGFLVWHPSGALYGVFQDFAGGVVVHSTGAAAGLAGALLLRPRLGYNGYDPIDVGPERLFRIAATHAPHNMPLAALGAFLLWIGWFGFNGGTLLAAGAPPPETGGPDGYFELGEAVMSGFGAILVNTTLAPCAAVASIALMQTISGDDLNMQDLLNGVIAGLVGVTAGADVLSPGLAVGAGFGAGLVFLWTKRLLVRLSIDDPVGAVPAHGLTGVFGAVFLSLAEPETMLVTAASQTTYALVIFAGAFVASAAAFWLAGMLCRIASVAAAPGRAREAWRRNPLRVDFRTEVNGLDERLHGQDAYNFRSLR